MNVLALDSSNKLVISPEALAIPEFSAIWENDTTKKKEKALKELSYVYFLADYSSVYQAYAKEDRIGQLKSDFNIRKISEDVEKAIKKYTELQNTPIMGFLQSARDAMESMKDYFSKVNFGERDLGGRSVFKPKEVSSCLKDCGGIIDSLEKLEEKAKSELYEKATSKGGSEIGAFEK